MIIVWLVLGALFCPVLYPKFEPPLIWYILFNRRPK